MNYTELIVKMINDMLEQDGGEVRIKRNELAYKIGCVPSQINYAISSRFTKERGFIVQSRRGDGGYVQIIKLAVQGNSVVLHIINCIGDGVDEMSARAIIDNLVHDKVIPPNEGRLILSAIAQRNFIGIDEQSKDMLRSSILKSMLLNYV